MHYMKMQKKTGYLSNSSTNGLLQALVASNLNHSPFTDPIVPRKC